jgi:16S rRNA processing protein RimM
MAVARILMGVLGRPHGVRGLMRVQSYADPPENLVAYGPLCCERGRWFSLRLREGGLAEVARIEGGKRLAVTTRGEAETLVNTRLFLPRERLPTPAADEFYLVDLIGLDACTVDGEPVGRVAAVHDYGGGASLEIGALLVPFTRAAVPQIDLAAGRVTVVPPAEVTAP